MCSLREVVAIFHRTDTLTMHASCTWPVEWPNRPLVAVLTTRSCCPQTLVSVLRPTRGGWGGPPHVTDDFVLKIIKSTPAKSCELDPIPTTLLYGNLDILLPTITNIINTSLTTGIVLPGLKTVIVKPLLKKQLFDYNLLKKTTAQSLTSHFCLKSLKKSFFTNFSPIFKQTTSATPFSQPIVQVTAPKPPCCVS